MHSRLLTYFLTVYEMRSISLAAEKLRISQPALTKSVQKLEVAVGTKLFNREARGLSTTPYADILARRVRLMDAEYQHALAEIQVAKGGGAELIRVGAGPVWYSCLLPPVIAAFTENHPDVRVRVQSGVIDTMVPGLRSGQFDVICTSLAFPAQSDFTSETIVDLRHAVIGGPNHPLLAERNVTANMMKGYDWVVLTDDQVGTGRVLGYFSAIGEPPPRIAVETSSPTQMFELMRHGQFLGQIPETMMSVAGRYGIARIDATGTFWNSPAGICYRHSEHRLPALNRFLDAIRSGVPAGA